MEIIKLTDAEEIEPIYLNKQAIGSFIRVGDKTVIASVNTELLCVVVETPKEILALIEEAELPKFTFYNNNVDFSKQKHNSRVQEIIDQAHANEILMREKDPTYGR